MNPTPRFRLAPCFFVSALLPLSAGCAVDRRPVTPERTISDSIGIEDAVVFRSDGGPIDETAEAAAVLPLAIAVRRAVETSPEIQAALARVRAAEAEADLAATLPNPVLSLVFRWPEGGGSPDVEAGVAADLLAILERPRRSSAAASRWEAEIASSLETALDVVAESRSLYARAQALEALAPLLEGRLATFDRLREVARARLDLGEGTRQELTSIDAERLELAVEASRRKRELGVARLRLARRIGEPSSAATWRLDPWTPPRDLPSGEAAWIGKALDARPEILALEWELRARGDESAVAGWDALDGATLGVDSERDGEWSVGPSASAPLPIFDAGGARRRRALALESEARHRLTAIQRAVVEDVRTSLAALEAAREGLDRVTGELVPLQERRRAEIESAYRLGHVDVSALLLAEQSLQAAQVRRVDLESDVEEALVRLQRAVGGPAAYDSTLAASSRVERSEP